MLTTGEIITTSDGYTGTVSIDNLVRHLVAAGKTWKSYAEGLPSTGYIGSDSGSYVEHHNPFSYFSDVRNDNTQKQNLVNFSQFKTDLNAGTLPDFSFIVPDLNDDAHSGTDPLGTADAWLEQNIGPVLSSAQFQNGGLLIVWFDEAGTSDTSSSPTDSTGGGGHIAVVLAGPNVNTGFQSSTLYHHQDLLNAITSYMGVDPNIGAAAGPAAMTEFFKQ
jgi:acid phosphatase